ncbi:pentapeptide repeat-containing protein [Actinocorallia populi]|uniref:pentapeptide repeat-containing protein n=1 Tax=Actinocorallia populi TaxID=2079200 RepID=UPI0018E5446D|nr:pentapeptide repeat-containing protein [Actinocorallia populi]
MDLTPGGKVDLRGRVIGPEEWTAVRAAATAPDGTVRLGRCWFEDARFERVSFHGVLFERDVSFCRAEFGKGVSFYRTVFAGNVSFCETVFTGNASFHESVFHGHADFSRACFRGDALFGHALWRRDAGFTEAFFQSVADFDRAVFQRDAVFHEACFRSVVSLRHADVSRNLLLGRASFHDDAWIGPLTAGGRVGLDAARSSRRLRIAARAPAVTARHAVLDRVHLRTPADLSQAVVRELLLDGFDPDLCSFEEARIDALTVRGGPVAAEPERAARRPLAVAVSAVALLGVVLATLLSLRQFGHVPAHLAHLHP